MLGLLQLQNRPMMHPGCINNPASFSFPLLCGRVPGASVATVVNTRVVSEDDWIETARGLERNGARAITSNCGFAIRFQDAVARSVNVPVALSTLLLLPLLTRMVAGRIGVITYDGTAFDDGVFEQAGVRDRSRMVVVGIEGTPAYEEMQSLDNNVTAAQVEIAVAGAIHAANAREPIDALLFECAGFTSVSAAMREQFALPLFDAVTLANLLMSSRGTIRR